MTNPNNTVGTNGAYSGRTSVNAFNDGIAGYSRGILSGWSCVVSSGLTVSLGGVNGTRDVAVATDNNGNNTTIDNISESPINVTISSAPATNSRIDLIVAYVDNPPTGVSTTADNPSACGLIVVKGTANASPVEPDDGAIRTAITADGASGTTAYYVILASITIASGTTDLDASNITQGDLAQMDGGLIDDGSINASKIDWSTASSKTPFIINAYITANTNRTYTSDKGNVYGVSFVNDGSGAKITSGASNIQKVVTTISFRSATSGAFTERHIGVHGNFTNGSTARFKYISGLKNGTAISPVEVSGTTTGSYIQFDYNNTNISYSGVIDRTEWVRIAGSNLWYGFTEMNYYGNNTTYYGVAIATASDSSTVPTIYTPGTVGSISSAFQSIEIYE